MPYGSFELADRFTRQIKIKVAEAESQIQFILSFLLSASSVLSNSRFQEMEMRTRTKPPTVLIVKKIRSGFSYCIILHSTNDLSSIKVFKGDIGRQLLDAGPEELRAIANAVRNPETLLCKMSFPSKCRKPG